MSKKVDSLKIKDKKRDFILPFTKIMSLGVFAIGAVSMLISPIFNLTYFVGLGMVAAGFGAGALCVVEEYKDFKKSQKERESVRKMLIEEYVAEANASAEHEVVREEPTEEKAQNTSKDLGREA